MSILAFLLTISLPLDRVELFSIRLSTYLLLLSALALIYLIRVKRFVPTNAVDWAVLAFLAVCWISGLVSLSPHDSIYYASALTLSVVGYFYIRGISANITTRQRIIGLLNVVGVVVAIVAIYQVLADNWGLYSGLSEQYRSSVFGFARGQAFSAEPLYLAGFLLLPIALQLVAVDTAKPKINWSFTILLAAFFLTLSRSGFIALLVMSALVLAADLAHREFKAVGVKLAHLGGGAIIALLLVAAVSGWSGVRTFVRQALIVNAPVVASTEERISNGQEAWRIFTEHPILGVGIGSYDAASTLPYTTLEKGRHIVNNQYLEVLAEMGLLGFVAFVALIATILVSLSRIRPLRGIALGLGLAITGLAVQYLFFSTTHLVIWWFTLGLGSSLISFNEPDK